MHAFLIGLFLFGLLAAPEVLAHAIAEGDKGYIQEIFGVHLIPFAYLGAKHMLTGYDHLLFLLGVIFFLYRPRDILLYVTLFTLWAWSLISAARGSRRGRLLGGVLHRRQGAYLGRSDLPRFREGVPARRCVYGGGDNTDGGRARPDIGRRISGIQIQVILSAFNL